MLPEGRKGRPKGVSTEKIALIVSALYKNPEGLWLRELAKRTRLHPSTVSSYLKGVLKPVVIESMLGPEEAPILRVIRLKLVVSERLSKGEPLAEIVRSIRLLDKIKS